MGGSACPCGSLQGLVPGWGFRGGEVGLVLQPALGPGLAPPDLLGIAVIPLESP